MAKRIPANSIPSDGRSTPERSFVRDKVIYRLRKLRVVCRECNSGWMSTLENAAKPMLTKILEDSSFTLSQFDQACLARWLAMKTIVGEHAEKGISVTPLNDRKLFKDEGKIPDYFAIYIGRQISFIETAWQRMSQILASSPRGPNPPLNRAQHNIQTVTFICGPLLAFSVGVLEYEINASKLFNLPKLVQIYPPTQERVSWPPVCTLNSGEVNHIAFALDKLKNHPNVIYAGDPPNA